MSAPAPVIQLEHVRKEYAAPGGSVLAVLRDVSLSVAPGESVAVVGPSGSGKSTLLNLIGALDRPSAGLVRVCGEDPAALSDAALARLRNREIGFIFQMHHLLPQCTLLENVLLPAVPLHRRGDAGRETVARATDLLTRVGLGDRLDHRPGQLSGGERQRAAVVRALINRPRLLLADEPTGALDRAGAAALADLLLALNRAEQVTLVVVTHAAELARRLDRSFRLLDGVLTPLADAPS